MADLLDCVRGAGIPVEEASVGTALADSKAWARANGAAVCIAGSLYLAGDVLRTEGVEV